MRRALLLLTLAFVVSCRSTVRDDVDLVLVLKSGHDFLAEVTPDQYNLLHAQSVRRRFGFDSFLADEGTDDYVDAVEFFQRVKHRDGRKGILRVNL